MSHPSQAPRWRRRLGKALRFIAIVWGLALALKAMEAVALLLSGMATESGSIAVERP